MILIPDQIGESPEARRPGRKAPVGTLSGVALGLLEKPGWQITEACEKSGKSLVRCVSDGKAREVRKMGTRDRMTESDLLLASRYEESRPTLTV